MRGLPREPIPLERLDDRDLIGIALGEPHPTAPVHAYHGRPKEGVVMVKPRFNEVPKGVSQDLKNPPVCALCGNVMTPRRKTAHGDRMAYLSGLHRPGKPRMIVYAWECAERTDEQDAKHVDRKKLEPYFKARRYGRLRKHQGGQR